MSKINCNPKNINNIKNKANQMRLLKLLKEEKMKKIILKIDGMTCSACSSGLEKYLLKQKGIEDALVNLVMATASITYDDSLTITDLNRYVKEAGFTSLGEYDENNNAIWPKMSINYTTKTQFISRINKGVLDICEDNALNKKMLSENRRISTRNMIYFGDGLTDIPSMRMIRESNGYAIAVYQNDDKKVVSNLIKDNRIDFYAKANYEENSDMDKLIKDVLNEIAIKNKLNNLHKSQIKEVE